MTPTRLWNSDGRLEWELVEADDALDYRRWQPLLPDRWDLERHSLGYHGICWHLTGPDDRPRLVAGAGSGVHDVRRQAAIDAATACILGASGA